jgi:hypothetical protein
VVEELAVVAAVINLDAVLLVVGRTADLVAEAEDKSW